jgi:hypothetical protein
MDKKNQKFELKTFKLFGKYSEKKSKSAWKKSKRTIKISPRFKKKTTEPFSELVNK